ncbi:MAG TPA: protein kinase [Fimbriiglobus sp.]|nr:protein kinase [Fimbriiglobus sp.]
MDERLIDLLLRAEDLRQQGRPITSEELCRDCPELWPEFQRLLSGVAQVEQLLSTEGAGGTSGVDPAPFPAFVTPEVRGYQLLREIGRGGMGIVYEAVQTSLDRHVALKVLPNHAFRDPRQLQRFERESRLVARLHHTNIVPVYGTGEDNGLHYYVMQFIEGVGLESVLANLQRLQKLSPKKRSGPPQEPDAVPPESGPSEKHPLSSLTPDPSSLSDSGRPYWQSLARIGLQVAHALDYAHGQGVLHRDIKPSNLILDRRGTVWVTDFGMAKLADDDNFTQTGDVVGTLRYLAPERFRGRGDARADIYSLGLTLYELLTLHPAFEEVDRHKLVRRLLHEEPPPPRKLNARIPRDLETIVLKAIARDEARRYQTAAALASDLRHFLDDEPILARRQSQLERAVRWARHHPGMAVLGGVLTAVLVLATVASLLAAGYFNQLRLNEAAAARSERDARHDAELSRQAAEQAGDEARRRGDAERWERYRSNIAAASAALQLQNSGAARDALDGAPTEHRNWEWRYLHSQLDGASLVLPAPGGKYRSHVLSPSGRQVAVSGADHHDVHLYDVASGKVSAVLRGHSAPVTSVAYRPDGKQIATAGNDRTIRVWDPETGQELARLRAEMTPAEEDRNLVLAYNSDGRRMASYAVNGQAGTTRLWDADTGNEIAVLGKWRGYDSPVAFSPDGKRVAVASGEHLLLCDAVTGRRLAVLAPHAMSVRHLAYSPDGKRIACTDGANTIHLWDGASGKEVSVLRGHTGRVDSVLFSPDGSRLLSASNYPDSTARLWDAVTGRSLAVLAGHKNAIWSVAFSPDGRRVATASTDQTARLWDGYTGELLAVLGGHTGWVPNVLFSPNGTRVVTASEDATLRLWNADTGDLIGVLRGHGDGFNGAPVFTPDGSRLVSGARDGTVRIWDLSLVERNGILSGHEGYVYDVAFSPDGEQVASAAWDGTARLWDATTGRQTGLLQHQTGIISSVDYDRDGRRLVTMERQLGVRLWDVASRKTAHDWRLRGGDALGDARASLNPAGTLLAAGCIEGPVRLYDVATGREVARLEGHDRNSIDVAFHPDGSVLATTGMDKTVRLWTVAGALSSTQAEGERGVREVAVLRGHTGEVWRVAFSADGKLLASGSQDKTIRLWDVASHEQLAVIPLRSIVYSVAFSPDGARLAAGCRDHSIRLIDVARRQQVAELRGHTDYVHAVAWSPDGTRLVSGSGDFTVRVWDSLSAQERAKRAADKTQAR